MKFEDLEFKSHSIGNGGQTKIFFPNGYGASIVKFRVSSLGGSYGVNDDLWGLAVFKGNEEKHEICYDTSVTNDVLGHLTEDEVIENLELIK